MWRWLSACPTGRHQPRCAWRSSVAPSREFAGELHAARRCVSASPSGTYAVRLSRISSEASYATIGPALCVAAQGAKVVMLGREVLEYDPAHLLVLAVGLPVSSHVVQPVVKTRISASYWIWTPRVWQSSRHGSTRAAFRTARVTLTRVLIRASRCHHSPSRERPLGAVSLKSTPEVRRATDCRSGVVDSRAFRATRHGRGDGRLRAHDGVVIPSAVQSGDLDQSAAIPKGSSSTRSTPTHAFSRDGCERCVPARWLPESVAIQQGVRPLLWKRANERHRSASHPGNCLGPRGLKPSACFAGWSPGPTHRGLPP